MILSAGANTRDRGENGNNATLNHGGGNEIFWKNEKPLGVMLLPNYVSVDGRIECKFSLCIQCTVCPVFYVPLNISTR